MFSGLPPLPSVKVLPSTETYTLPVASPTKSRPLNADMASTPAVCSGAAAGPTAFQLLTPSVLI